MDVVAEQLLARSLGVTWAEAWLTILVATAMYALIILLSRLFGQGSFATSTSYDLAFIFALGSLIGRVILVRTSLGVAAIGLSTLFVLHRLTGWLHHSFVPVHHAIQNPPVLVAADGRILHDQLRPSELSAGEILQGIRLKGYGSLADVRAVVLEANGELSVLPRGRALDGEVYEGVRGSEQLDARG